MQRVPHALRPPAVTISALEERKPADQGGEGDGGSELRREEEGEGESSQGDCEQSMTRSVLSGDLLRSRRVCRRRPCGLLCA